MREDRVEGEHRIEVRLERAGGAIRAMLRIDGQAHRVEAPECDHVLDAASLIIAVAVDPRGATMTPAPREVTPSASSPVASSPVASSSPAIPDVPPRASEDAGAPVPVTPALSAPVASTPAPSPPRPVARRFVSVGLAAQALVFAYPHAALGGALLVTWERERGWLLRAAASLAATALLGPSDRATFVLPRGTVEACPLHAALGQRLGLRPCLGLSAGIALADGRGAVVPGSDAGPWLSASLGPRLSVALGRTTLDLAPSLELPLVRTQYLFATPRTRVHQVPPVALGIEIGGRFRL